MEIHYCRFCDKTFYYKINMAIHFIREHQFNTHQDLSTCPLCSFQTLNIIDHMTQCHPNNCYFCVINTVFFQNHVECEQLLKKAMAIYQNQLV